MFLGVSVTTIATTIIIHGDAVSRPENLSSSAQEPQTIPSDNPSPQRKKPPMVDENFDRCSDSKVFEDKAVNISRCDSILLARYIEQS